MLKLSGILVAILSSVTLHGQTDNEWRNAESNKLQSLPIEDLRTSKHLPALSLSGNDYVLQLVMDSNRFKGHLVLFTSTYTGGDYKSLYSRKYFTDQLIDSDTAQLIYQLYNDLDISTIPTYQEIRGWRPGTDGIVYTIDCNNAGRYSSKSYWSPWAFKDLPQAVTVDKFVSEVERLLHFQDKRKHFLTSLPKGKSYRFGALSIITVSENPKDATWVNEVTVAYRQSDEPPVVGGWPEYKLIFNREGSDLVSAFYTRGKNRIALEDTVSLNPSVLTSIVEWAKDKNQFSLRELDLKMEDLRLPDGQKKYELTFPVPDNFSVSIDSLTFCKKHSMMKVMSTGGDHISVTITYNNHKEYFQFDNNTLFQEFDFKAYLTCYAILKDAMPEEFPAYNFFSQEMLVRLLSEYQKTVECEGYYYKKYVSEQPDLTPQERRTMKGWNFADYLKNHGKE